MGTVGVGMVEAGIGASRRLAAGEGAAVVLVGTCGALPGSGLEVGDVVVVARARVGSASVLAGNADLPPPMPAEVIAPPELLARAVAAGARSVTALTTLGITTADDLAAALAAHGEVEHLEAFAVARAAESVGLPWCAVLAVANPVGSAGRAAWRAHHVDASARAAETAAAALLAAP